MENYSVRLQWRGGLPHLILLQGDHGRVPTGQGVAEREGPCQMVRKCPWLYPVIDDHRQQMALHLVHLSYWDAGEHVPGESLVRASAKVLYYG